MAHLISFLTAAAAPKGLWESIIQGIYKGVGNYGFTIILITLLIKLFMLPFDFYQRYTQKSMTAQQAKMAPELTKAQKRYVNDKESLNRETMAIYKKHNFKPVGNCLAMILYIGVMLTVFITLINGINKMSSYKMVQQYEIIEAAYEGKLTETGNIAEAKKETVAIYNKNTESFLWIKNIWRKDTSETVIADYKNADAKIKNLLIKRWKEENPLKSNANKTEKAEYNKEAKAAAKTQYDAVMKALRDKYGKQWNGWFLLMILAVASTFLTAKLSAPKKKTGNAQQDAMTKSQSAMGMWLMPIIMGIFTLTSSSPFGLYLVFNQIFTLGTNAAINPLCDKLSKKKENKTTPQSNKPEYSRDNLKK